MEGDGDTCTAIVLGYDNGRIAGGPPGADADGHVVNLREPHVSHVITHRNGIRVCAIRAIPNTIIE